MVAIGETRTVTKEEVKALRKQGWLPRNDLVVMMFVDQPDTSREKASQAAKECWKARRAKNGGWTDKQHAFVARKLAEASA